MSENNIKAKKNCGPNYMVGAIVGCVLTVIGQLLYQLIPVSDIANSIEYSSKTGIIVLAFAPVCAVLAFAVYLVGGLTDKALVKNSVVELVIFIVSAVILLVVAGITAAMFFSQLSLGFVAPVTGTVWSTLGTVNIILSAVFAAGNIYILATARK